MRSFVSKAEKGFTLVELLVVIAIIGLLASVVLASLNTARRKSRDARRIADIKQVQLALELYNDVNRQYPAGGGVALAAALVPSYIPTLPRDPLGVDWSVVGVGSAHDGYRYCALPAALPTSYHLGALLEDSATQALNSDSNFNDSCVGGGDPIDGRDSNGGATDGTDCSGGGITAGDCYNVQS